MSASERNGTTARGFVPASQSKVQRPDVADVERRPPAGDGPMGAGVDGVRLVAGAGETETKLCSVDVDMVTS